MNANIFCNKCHRIPSQCGCGRVLGYELADELQETEPYYSTDYKLFDKSANILRQQADRIAHLEMLVANRNEIIDKLDLTKPQIKELSDEEIERIYYKTLNRFDFARAILKKASEK